MQTFKINVVPPPANAANEHQATIMITVRGGPDVDLQPIFSQPLGQPAAPFHERNRIGSMGIQIKIIQLRCAGEPVGIDVDQVRLARVRSASLPPNRCMSSAVGTPIATGSVLVKITPCGTIRASPKPRWCQKAIKSASSSRA